MRVAAKLLSVVLFGVVLLVAVDGYLTVRGETTLYQADMRRDAIALGRALRPVVERSLDAGGERAAIALIRDINHEGNSIRVRWVGLHEPTALDESERPPQASLEQLLRGEEALVIQRDSPRSGYLRLYIPLVLGGRTRGALELSESLAPLAQYTRNTVKRTLVLGGLMVAFGGLMLVLFGVRVVGQPLQSLAEKVRAIGAGDLSTPVHLRAHDEIGEVATALNGMCERLKESQERVREETAARIAALEQLRHGDRLRTVGRLAAGVAHEVGTPLNVVSGRAGMIVSGALSGSEVVDSASIIKTQCDRIVAIMRQLLDFARRRPLQRRDVDVQQLVRQTVELIHSLTRKRDTTLQVHEDGNGINARIDPGQIQQVLTNLAVNALQASPAGGRVEVGVRREVAKPPAGSGKSEAECVCLYVRDQGTGIAPEHKQHIFEPFFTTKDVGDGTGLGLSIAYGIVQEHGGWIDVDSEPGKGSCFTVYLPEEDGACTDES